MAQAITVRERTIQAATLGGTETFEILAGDNFLVIGVSYTGAGTPDVDSILVDGVAATHDVTTKISSSVNVEMWHIHNPHVGAAIVISAGGTGAGNLAMCVWKCNLANVASTVRDTGLASGTPNDDITVTIDSDPLDHVFYIGRRDGGAPTWKSVTTSTSKVRDTVGADEAGSSPTASGTFGVTGSDENVVAVGMSVKRGRAGSGRAMAIG
jgi:hypothetical protein